jgi:hypothetical protein
LDIGGERDGGTWDVPKRSRICSLGFRFRGGLLGLRRSSGRRFR